MNPTIRLFLLSFLMLLPAAAREWWNPAWTQRQSVTVDAGPDGAGLGGPARDAVLLLRLHDGNFPFASAAADGSDLRFVAADGRTLLPHRIEKWDGLLNEAFVWVRVPEVNPASPARLDIYLGGGDPAVTAEGSPDGPETRFVHHFGRPGSTPEDASGNGHHFEGGQAVVADGSLIGSGLRLTGGEPPSIPASPDLATPAGGPFTLSLWLRPSASQPRALVFGRSAADGGAGLRLLLDEGLPLLEIDAEGGTRGAPAVGEPLAAGTWAHLAVVAQGDAVTLLVDGEPRATLAGPVPALDGPFTFGGPAGPSAFLGEIDELRFETIARTTDSLRLAAVQQGATDTAARTLVLGETSASAAVAAGGHSEALEHVMLFGDIARNMMFDGWIAVGVCVLMIIVGWTVAAQKFAYLNSIQKGGEEFLAQWKKVSTDLTALDHGNGKISGEDDPAATRRIENTPLFRIYQIGSDEIRHRLERDKNRTKGLSGRSIQAIRAALDGGLVRETQRLTNGLVYLTISIAGGPYVGLLGTVVGVMITFALIAKTGEVEVNSIAPGIASALLATVAGLVVAIPALFMYSYLNGRIRNITAGMHVFIDEFVAKMAEFYPPEGESSPHLPPAAPDSPPPASADHPSHHPIEPHPHRPVNAPA